MKRSIASLGCLAASLTLGACVGSIGDGDGDGDQPGTSQSSLCVVDTPIRRLTRFEYNNTVRDLLGDTTAPASGLPPEEEVQGFNNQAAALTTSELLVEQYMRIAEEVSLRATADMPKLIGGCDYQTDASACADAFIADFGKRAFRRPLTDAETSRLRGLYDWAVDDPDLGTFEDGIQLVIQEVLQSPSFLYRPELGGALPVDGDVVPLTGYEMATKLSYMLWNSMPDDILFEAAEKGELQTQAQLEAQARRMLKDGKAHDAILNFHRQWLQLNHLDTLTKDPAVYPLYNDGLRPLWKDEIERFVEHVIFEDDGSLAALFSADYTFANQELATFYGDDITGDLPTGDQFEKVSVDPSRRAGFLTMSAVMATHANLNQSSPVFRGKFVREQLMCDILPLPPNNLVITPPELDPEKTTREQFEEIGNNPDCASCHLMMNPIGFGFENYDAIGQWRDTQNGKTIDATGEIVAAADDLVGEFDGAVDLGQKLAASSQVAECVTSQWFRFAYNRTVTKDDACNLDQLNEAFAASDFNIRELLVALTQTETFRFRHQVVPGGGDQ
ncbi:MAG: DUF1592 domain-containing protein [Myxococcales bacterium]|nr:DUF1592 domain-containing protein [Myxococcales bacterium]